MDMRETQGKTSGLLGNGPAHRTLGRILVYGIRQTMSPMTQRGRSKVVRFYTCIEASDHKLMKRLQAKAARHLGHRVSTPDILRSGLTLLHILDRTSEADFARLVASIEKPKSGRPANRRRK